MSCNCGNPWHYDWCPEFLAPAEACPAGPKCDELVSTDCVLYTGPDIPCYGITTNMTITEVLDILYHAIYPNCLTTTTSSTSTTTTLNPCAICTGTAATPTIACLIGLKIEFLYIASIGDLTKLPSGYVHPCPTSIGVHNCNRSLHEVYMAGHYVGDALMNNDDGNCGSITAYGTPICKDYKNTPAPIVFQQNWTGTEHSRYNAIVIGIEEATQISNANGGSQNITFTLDHAVTKYGITCDGSQSAHDHKVWVRISKPNGTVIYNACQQDGTFTVNVCGPAVTTTSTSTSTTTTTTINPCPSCRVYNVQNPTASPLYVGYVPCGTTTPSSVIVNPGNTVSLCSCIGSISAPAGLVVTNVAACSPGFSTTTSTSSTTSTTTIAPTTTTSSSTTTSTTTFPVTSTTTTI